MGMDHDEDTAAYTPVPETVSPRKIQVCNPQCRKGSEALLPDLFESVCAVEGYHTALTWLDDHSELYQTLRANRRMGALNRMLNAKPGLVYAFFPGLTTEETEKFYDSPAYISGFDFS